MLKFEPDTSKMYKEIKDAISMAKHPSEVPNALARLYALRDYWKSHLGRMVPRYVWQRIEETEEYLIGFQTFGY